MAGRRRSGRRAAPGATPERRRPRRADVETTRSCATRATRHASARAAGSVWVSRATEPAAAARNSGSGAPRRSAQAASATPRRAAGASGSASSAARYQGPCAAGTRRRASASISSAPAAAASARSTAGESPRGPSRGPWTSPPRSRSGGVPAETRGRPASGRSSPARASAARSVSLHGARRVDLEVGEGALLGERHLRLDARQGRPARRGRPGRGGGASCWSGSQCTTTSRSNLRCAPASTRRAASVTSTAAPRPARSRARRASSARTRGWTMAFSRARAPASVNTTAASAARSSEPSGPSDPGAEGGRDLVEGGAARRGHVPRDGVEVEGVEAVAGQPPQDVGLAAGDAAGQADPEHALRRRRPPPAPCWRAASRWSAGRRRRAPG